MEELMAGRVLRELAEPWTGTDSLFASVRVDGRVIEGGRFAHSTFANVSFLGASIQRTEFLDCIFVNCYFRNASLVKSKFVGCKFIDCNFLKTSIKGGDYSYSEFKGCHLPFEEFQFALPSQPNLRLALAQNCALAADTLGHAVDARKYRLIGLAAHKEHLVAAVKAESVWYSEHYKGIARVGAALGLSWYVMNAFLWKHGESAGRLLMVALLLALIIFPGIGYLLLAHSGYTFLDALWLSLASFLSIDRLSTIPLRSGGELSMVAVEGLLGILFAGLYVTVLVKALLRR